MCHCGQLLFLSSNDRPVQSLDLAASGGNVEAEREFSDNDNQRETDEEKLERQYFWKVVEAFLYYK